MNRKTYAFALLALVAALALAACGGGSGSGGGESESKNSASETTSGESGSGGYSGKGGAYAPPSEKAASGGGEGAAPVSTGKAEEVGEVLVDSSGMTLYYFEKDQKGSGVSTCSGACAEFWPPLLSEGEPKAMSGVQSSMLGTIERSDGTMQVTYAGWPLYTFAEDKKPGEAKGTDVKAFGAAWYPLHPNGEKAGH